MLVERGNAGKVEHGRRMMIAPRPRASQRGLWTKMGCNSVTCGSNLKQ
jgi:hypothetical protein